MPIRDTTQRVFRSAGAATFSQVWRVGVTFATTLVLMNLVGPGDWGLFDWAVVVFLILGAVRDLGLVYHIIRVRPRPYGNLLAVQLVWGSLLAAATLVGADTLAMGFRQASAEVVPVIRALSLFLFLEGVASVPRIFFDAELEVGRTVVPEIGRNLIFAGVSIALAWQGFGVWSMVTGLLAGTAYYAAHLWLRAWPTITLRYERGRNWALIRPSLPLASIWFLAILVRHVDPLILGMRFTDDAVGNYTRAYFFAFLVTATLVPAVTRVLYPALVAYASEPGKLLEAYRLATLFVLALEAPVAAFLFCNPHTFFRIFGGEWLLAPDFLRILSLAPLVDPFSRLGGEILKVYHRDRLWIVSLLLTLGCYAGLGLWLTARVGATGMAWANFFPLGGLLMAWGIRRIAPGPFSSLLRDIGWIYLAPVPPFLAAWLLAGDDLWLRFGLSIAAAAVVLAFYALRFGRSFVAFFKTPVAAPDARERS